MREDRNDNETSSARWWVRHDLLHVTPEAWESALSRSPSAVDLPLVRDWVDRGWPVIVRRRDATEDPRLVPIGVPLPPEHGKRRIALALDPYGVKGRSRPPLLRIAASAADPAWRSTIDSLLALGSVTGVEPRAFGSLMWQHQTGLTYLSPTSDIDVLWRIPAGFGVSTLLLGIAEIERDAGLRIDGEIVFPDGSGVNWRELLEAVDHATVLAKTMDGVRLVHTAQLLGEERIS